MKALERDNIIDDLLKKYPHGPKGVSLTYTHGESWCRERRKYVNVYTPSVPDFGYTDEVLFSLNIHSRNQALSYIQKRFFAGKNNWEIGRQKSTVTRRANRLWQRLSDPVSQVLQRGAKGIYKIGRMHRSSAKPMGYVFACSVDEANTVMRTFFPTLDPGAYTAYFVEIGNIEKLHEYNKLVQEMFVRKKQDLEKEIKRAEGEIAQLDAHSEMVDVLVGHQIACES